MTTTAPPARKSRVTWSQAEIAALVTHFQHGGIEAVQKHFGPDADKAHAKLVTLGFIPKPEAPTLDDEIAGAIYRHVLTLAVLDDPQRTLALRYAIRELRAVMPKRTPTEKET